MSAGIVNKYMLEVEEETDFFGYNHKDPIPTDIDMYKTVIFVDIAFEKEDMIGLAKRTKVIVVDHHITTKKMLDEIHAEYNETSDFNLDYIIHTHIAACEVVFEYFYPLEQINDVITLLGKYDTFRHAGTPEEDKVQYFQNTARIKLKTYKDCTDLLFALDSNYVLEMEMIDTWVMSGKLIYDGMKNNADRMHKTSFPVILEGKTFLCNNAVGINPKAYKLDYSKYDGYLLFHYNVNKWIFTLYSDTTDVSIIAKKLGGGGHKGAAGFHVDNIELFLNQLKSLSR
jgi:oligoribonuclease NrnB/cAMP/cGMP phosphodiesterase (DHH superfamily)